MKEILTRYAQYNLWANKLVIDAMLALPDSAIRKEIPSSFPTLHATAAHVWGAEDTWLQRLMLVPHPTWQGGFTGQFEIICDGWRQSSATLEQFIAAQDETSLHNTCAYSDRRGDAYITPVFEILHHVFNHSTYHRGQMITMLRQAGATQIPGTDFIGFVRMGR